MSATGGAALSPILQKSQNICWTDALVRDVFSTGSSEFVLGYISSGGACPGVPSVHLGLAMLLILQEPFRDCASLVCAQCFLVM
jgi:hypothetical protein